MTAGRVLDDRYLIEQPLGSGGMGAVWRGRDLRLDRPVAVKELTSAGLGLPLAIQRFDREARAVARLAHPNIVAVHDVGTDGDHPYLVMELVEGRSLAAMLDDGPLPVASAVAIAAQACDGLAAAHAAGIVHRDVKPANLLLTGGGLVKICDFGIARLHDSTGDVNLTGNLPALGSCRYMAPEQIAGGPVDARTDLYSLGCTLYAMLAGRPPFTGDQQAVVAQQQTEAPAPLSGTGVEVPPVLEALVQQLLRKDPAERPGDARTVRSRLLLLVHDLAVARVPASPIPLVAVPEAAAVGAIAPRPADPPSAAVVDDSTTAAEGSTGTPARRRAVPLVALLLMAVTALIAVFATRLFTAADQVAADAPPAMAAPPAAMGVSSAPSPRPTGSAVRSAVPVTTTVTVTVTPARASATTRSSAPSSPPAPVDPIVAMRLAIHRQVDMGHLNPTKAPDLYKAVDNIAHSINTDNPDAKKRISDLRDKLDELRTSGTLTTGGYDALVAKVDSIAASLP